ncbi:MAG: S8 family serine peptidase [bacterium]
MKKAQLICMLIIGTAIPNYINALFDPYKNISDEIQYEPGMIIINYKLKKTAERKSKPSSIRDEHEMVLEALRNSIENFPEVKMNKDGMNTKPVNSALVKQMSKSNKSEFDIINRIQNNSLRKRRRRLKKELSTNRYLRSKKFAIEFADKKVDIIRLQRTIEDVQDFGELPIQEVTAQPNYILRVCTEPNDPKYSEQWGLEKISAAQAWNVTTGDSGIIIAMIDTGVDYNHVDLRDKIWINEDEIAGNGIDDDGNGYVDDFRGYNFTAFLKNDTNNPMDIDGHGTHTAGIAAASTDNNIGIAGVARECKIMAIKSDFTTISIERAILYAIDNGADIISMSFGGATEGGIAVEEIAEAYEQGVVLVAAAGNNGRFPGTDGRPAKIYPAASQEVIAIAATDLQDQRAYFSNYGDWVDLAAPGIGIMSTYKNGGYAKLEGTSMSTPFVSGAAGLLLSLNDTLTPEEVRSILKDSAVRIDTDKDIGAGRLDLYKAVNFLSAHTSLGYNINITKLSKKENYLADDNEISFGCHVSYDNLREVRVILTNSVTGNKVNLIDSNPEVDHVASYPHSLYEYHHSWEGSELSSLNDGEYTYEIKALHDDYGEGSSQKQAFSWAVISDAKVDTGKNYDIGIYNDLSRYSSTIIEFEIKYPSDQNAGVHIIQLDNRDFDSSPEVATELVSWDVDYTSDIEWILKGFIKATNTSPDIDPFIIDRQPPEIIASANPRIFSPGITESQIDCTITDNLPLQLSKLTVVILDKYSIVINTLSSSSLINQGSYNFVWDGTGSNTYNNGAVVKDGTYAYKITATDFAGNLAEYTENIIVDTLPPKLIGNKFTVIPADHPNPDTFSSNDEKIDFSFSTSDNINQRVNVEIKFTTNDTEQVVVLLRNMLVDVTSSLQTIVYSWDGKDDQGNYLPDGNYSIELFARDLAENRSAIVVLGVFGIDRTPSEPEILYVDNFMFTPDDGESGNGDGIRDTVTLYYTLTEKALVRVSIDDTLGREQLILDESGVYKTTGTALWSGKTNGSYVSDGQYVFRIKTVDDVGNIADASLPVIKNQIPAKIMFPSNGGEEYVKGVVTIKGIALDPKIQNSQDFKQYTVWYREGANIDFSMSENNPLNPDPILWKPVPVPISYQRADDTDYPYSNVSYRAVNYTRLAYWNTQLLQNGGVYTILLSVEDEGGNSSFDWRKVTIDHSLQNSSPVIRIVTPQVNDTFTITSSNDRLRIVYELIQQSENKSDISLEICKTGISKSAYGPIVYQQAYFNITEAEPIIWDGRDFRNQYMDKGTYRIRLTCMDTDGLGVDVVERNIVVDPILSKPLEIIAFNVTNSIVSPGQTVDITYKGSKEARVSICIYDSSAQMVETLIDSIITVGGVDRVVRWIPTNEGLYECKLHAVSTDENATESNASLSIAVTSSGHGGGTAEIAFPVDGAVLKGNSYFTWQAHSQGNYYPPQEFEAHINTLGEQVWSQSSWSDDDFSSIDKIEIGSSIKLGQEWIAEHTWIQKLEMVLLKHFEASEEISPRTAESYGFVVTWDIPVPSDSVERRNIDQTCVDYTTFDVINLPRGPSGPGVFAPPIVQISKQVNIVVYSQKNTSWNDSISSWYKGDIYGEVSSGYWEGGWIFYASGDIISKPKYVGWFLSGKLSVNVQSPDGTTIKFYTSTSNDAVAWELWQPVAADGTLQSNPGKYLRWKAELTTYDTTKTPIIDDVTIFLKWQDEKILKSDNASQWSTTPNDCYYGNPLLSYNLGAILPIPANTQIQRVSPFYSLVDHTNSLNVSKTITNSQTGYPYYLLKAETNVFQGWSSNSDQLLKNGMIVSSDNVFNNDPNPLNFTVHSLPISFSSSYPDIAMWADEDTKNKYSFWEGNSSLIDNPHVNINSLSWDIGLYYPDGTVNNDIAVERDLTKLSNQNDIAIDDDFRVRIAPGACSREFITLKGTTSTLASGFKSYALFYKKKSGTIWQTIPPYTKEPVLNGNILAYWDVSSLNGEYEVRLVVLDGSGQNETIKQMTIGTLVPGYGNSSTDNTYVTAPYNKAWLDFPKDALEDDTYVTITPMKIENTDIVVDPSMPHPIGFVCKLQPHDIEFRKDDEGNALSLATLSVRFLYEELEGIDPATLTIYHMEDDGSLESFDVKITYDSNGDGKYTPEDIVTVTSPVERFSYYLVIPTVEPPTLNERTLYSNKRKVTVSGESEGGSTVALYVNGASIGQTETVGNIFSMDVPLVEGNNYITATTIRWFNSVSKTSDFSEPLQVILDLKKPEIIAFSDDPDPFSPDGDKIRDQVKISYTLSEDSSISISIVDGTKNLVRNLCEDLQKSFGPNEVYWDGTNNEGEYVQENTFFYVINAHDNAGNVADEKQATIEVTYVHTSPPAPRIVYPLEGEYISNQQFAVKPDETVEKLLQYKIEVSIDEFNTITREFDQTITQEGWTSDNSTLISTYTVLESEKLSDGIYSLRAYSFDGALWSEASQSVIFTIDTVPPPVTQLIYPENYIEIENPRPCFQWTQVEDNVSGVRDYEIQVDDLESFDSPEYSVYVDSHQVIPDRNLPIDDLYWRVRARDNAGNYGEWSGIKTFGRLNAKPVAPVLFAPADREFIAISTPTFLMHAQDLDGDELLYKLEISADGFSNILHTYIQEKEGQGWVVDPGWEVHDDGSVSYTLSVQDALADNVYTWRTQAYDGIEWSVYSSTSMFIYDTVNPVIDIESPLVDSIHYELNHIVVSFTVSDIDPAPAITAEFVHHDTGERIPVRNGQEIDPLEIDDGLWKLVVTAVDGGGNTSSAEIPSFEVNHDTLPPHTLITIGDPNGEGDLITVRSITNFKLTAVDDYTEINDREGIGVKIIEFKIDEEDWLVYESTFTLNLEDGEHSISYRSTDVYGHQEETHVLTVLLDNSSPKTVLVPSGKLYNDGVNDYAPLDYKYAITTANNSIDISLIEVTIDEKGWNIYSSSIAFDTGGIHTIKYHSIDLLGNQEDDKDFMVVVDSAVPKTDLIFDESIQIATPQIYFLNSQSKISLSAQDPLLNGYASQVREINYSINGSSSVPFNICKDSFSIAGIDGEYDILFYSVDNVGNTEDTRTISVKLDNTPPDFEIKVNGPQYLEEGIVWISTATEIMIIPNDNNGSGVNKTEYRVDNEEYTELVEEAAYFTIPAGGSRVIYARCEDNLGNIREETYSVFVDTIAPITSVISAKPVFNIGEAIIAPLANETVFEVVEDGSGLDHVEYCINGGEWIRYIKPVVVLEEGKYTIVYCAIDNIGNRESEKQFTVSVDATCPKIMSLNPAHNELVFPDKAQEIVVAFSENIKTIDSNWSSVFIIEPFNMSYTVPGTYQYDSENFKLYFKSTEALALCQDYEVRLANGVTDIVGNQCRKFESSFTVMINKLAGGKVNQDEVGLIIVPGSLSENGVLRIQKETGFNSSKVVKPYAMFNNESYYIHGFNDQRTPLSNEFNKNIELRINYGIVLANIKKAGSVSAIIPESKTFRIFMFNEEINMWGLVKETVDNTEEKILSASISRLGRYALMSFANPGESLEDLTNFPNPFPAYGRNDTTIQYYLKEDAQVKVVVYDLLGNLVKRIDVAKGAPGQGQGGIQNQIVWDGRNGQGELVANGGYICIVKMDSGSETKVRKRKILVVK